MGDQRVNGSGATAQLSAKIMEAQVYFQKVVKHELQVLVATGLEREVAVKMLLRRIVQSTYEPEESDVRRVMRQFQMIHDDAVRALIVKQEIGRLKRQGLDAFAAIELLTRKMKGISVPDDAGDKEENDEETKENEVNNEEMSDHSASAVDGDPVGADDGRSMGNAEMSESIGPENTEANESQPAEEKRSESTNAETDELLQTSSVEAESTPTPSQDINSAASLTLCERIDQVSISASPHDVLQPGRATSPPVSPALSTSHTTPRSAFTLFSAHSRKRRVTSGSSSPLTEVDDAPVSPRIGVSGSSASSNHRPHFSISRPLSPTFRFPKNKKQKVWTDDENNEPLVESILMKETSLPPPASPTGVGTATDTPSSSNTATPIKVGKRRRAVRGGSMSPELDEIDAEDPMIRVTKRHKL